MRSAVDDADLRELHPGRALEGPDLQHLWRVESGALRIDELAADGSSALVCMALPGDLVGIGLLARRPLVHQARALTPSRLVRLRDDTAARQDDLPHQALAQASRRCREMVHLRTGSAVERIKHLLLMLAERDAPAMAGEDDCALPSLRDMAALVDSAPETVSRVLGSLRRLDVLHDRKPSSVRFRRADLDQLKPVPGMTSSAPSARPAERTAAVHVDWVEP